MHSSSSSICSQLVLCAITGVVVLGVVLGAAGMFLAVPIIVIVKIVITDIYRDRREMQKAEEGEQ